MKDSDPRVAARAALAIVLGPLTKFALEIGLSARELQDMCRAAVVQAAADRQRESRYRLNKSGIAAATGIPRAEVTRILRTNKGGGKLQKSNRPHSINRIISVWNEDPKFNNKNGRPADLLIFGPGRTFEALASKHGGGLPIRALLDELLRLGLVELTGQTKIKLRSSVFVNRGLNSREQKLLSRKVAQLIEGAFNKLLNPGSQFIISNIEGDLIQQAALPLLRKEFTSGSDDFLTGFRENLFRYEKYNQESAQEMAGHKIRVTVLYQEESLETKKPLASLRRKNFRRAI